MCKAIFHWLRSITICFWGSAIFSVFRTTDLADGGGGESTFKGVGYIWRGGVRQVERRAVLKGMQEAGYFVCGV